MVQSTNVYDFFNKRGLDFKKTPVFKLVKILDKGNCSSHSYFIAGGSLRRTMLGEDLGLGDLDCFFRTYKALSGFAKAITLKNSGYLRSLTPHSLNLFVQIDGSPHRVQAVQSRMGSLDKILEGFDLTICQIGLADTRLFYGERTLWDLANKKLVLTDEPENLRNPSHTKNRVFKYTSMGYSMDAKMFERLDKQSKMRDDLDNMES